jgi:YesN/AraC family two-component response regulator
MLDHEDGLQFASELRNLRPEIGILMLTSRSEMVDRISGLEMGADDYLSKPFNLRELLARVRSVLRRSAIPDLEKSDARWRARFAGGTLDLLSRKLFSPSGEDVRLTSGEFELLAILVNHANQVLSRDRLFDLTRHREAGLFIARSTYKSAACVASLRTTRSIQRLLRRCAAAATYSRHRSILHNGDLRAASKSAPISSFLRRSDMGRFPSSIPRLATAEYEPQSAKVA